MSDLFTILIIYGINDDRAPIVQLILIISKQKILFCLEKLSEIVLKHENRRLGEVLIKDLL